MSNDRDMPVSEFIKSHTLGESAEGTETEPGRWSFI